MRVKIWPVNQRFGLRHFPLPNHHVLYISIYWICRIKIKVRKYMSSKYIASLFDQLTNYQICLCKRYRSSMCSRACYMRRKWPCYIESSSYGHLPLSRMNVVITVVIITPTTDWQWPVVTCHRGIGWGNDICDHIVWRYEKDSGVRGITIIG